MAGITNGGLDVAAAAFGGSTAFPTHIAVGESGLTFNVNQSGLGLETDRNQIDTNDFSIDAQVTNIANWSPTDISGTILREVGEFNSGTGGIMSSRNVLVGSLVFDGESELQIQKTTSFFI